MKALILFCSLFVCILASTAQSLNWDEFTDLIEKKYQPNNARVWLTKNLFSSVRKNDLYDVNRIFNSFLMTTSAMEEDERTALFFRLDSLSRNLPSAQRAITQLTLMRQLPNNQWIPYRMMAKPVVVGNDTIHLTSRKEMYVFMYERLQAVEKDREQLKRTKLPKEFSYFIEEKLQLPTAFDFVTHEVIKLYANNNFSRWLERDYGYTSDANWLLNSKEFIAIELNDTTFTEKVVSLYQELERFNQSDLERLSQFHYLRLNYVRAFFAQKEMMQAYTIAFEHYKKYAYRSKFLIEVAKMKFNNGRDYHFLRNPEVEGLIKEAYDLLIVERKTFPKSEVASQIDALLGVIESKDMEMLSVNTLYPGEPLPLKLSYRNMDSVDVYVLAENTNKRLDNYELFQIFDKENAISEVAKKTFSLHHKGLYQKRSFETLLPEVKTEGNYVLLVVPKGINWRTINKSKSNWGEVTAAFSRFQVTEITAALENSSDGTRVIVTDYKTGKPISNAKIDVFYSRFSEIFESIPVKKGKTDKNGVFNTKLKDFKSFTCKINHNRSEILLSGYSSGSYSSNEVTTASVFTDRAIYRPGQRLHFKAIYYQGNYQKNEYAVIPDEDLTVKLYDANYQLVYEQVVKSNAFGSVSGTFNLPASGLLGRYSLSINDKRGNHVASHGFSIEEYKRPTFQVALEQPKTIVKLDDSVIVYGDVKAFAGFPLSDVNVRYTVYREPSYFWWYRPIGLSSSRELMTTGETKTDGQGRFAVAFLASADSKGGQANFNFSIEAEVTDVSGETHKNNLSLNVSKTGLFLSYEGSDNYIFGKKGIAKIALKNAFNKEQASKKATLTLYRKKESPNFIKRIWEEAEYTKFDSLEWVNAFPYAYYNAINRDANAEDEYELVKEMEVETNIGFDLDKLFDRMGSGTYRMKGFVTEGEDSVFMAHAINFLNDNDKNYKLGQALWTTDNYLSAEVGEEVTIRYGSGFSNANVMLEVYSGHTLKHTSWRQIDGMDRHTFTVRESDRGGMTVLLYTVNQGVRYYQTITISVPFDNKILEVEASVFRDKLYPGQDEEWRFTVKDKTGGKLESEMLASMYDASLDEFMPHNFSFWPYRNSLKYFNQNGFANKGVSRGSANGDWRYYYYRGMYDQALYGGTPGSYYDADYYYDGISVRGSRESATFAKRKESLSEDRDEVVEEFERSAPLIDNEDAGVKMDNKSAPAELKKKQEEAQPQVRKNFDETAFFYPHLQTNDKGEIVVRFTLPESLTKWNFKAFAHTKDIKLGSLDLSAVAQKELMISANVPRFYRRGDKAIFSSRITNLTEEELSVAVELTFFNPVNDKEIKLFSAPTKQKISVGAGRNKAVEWEIDLNDVPDLVAYKIVAKSKKFSDGEQKVIPVLDNRQFITEALPFVTVGKGTHRFTFDRFKNSTSTTIDNHNYTLEYTANPIWQVVLALPYMTDYPYECAEQVFTRFFANSLAAQVIGKKPELQKTLEIWKNHTPEAFFSELNKNEELKTVLLEETPWVMQAKNEEEQRRRVIELFDMYTLNSNLERSLALLKRKQNRDGGFGWFGGNRSNSYITQHIVSGFGYLKQLNVTFDDATEKMIDEALRFLTNEYYDAYRRLTQKQRENLSVSSMTIHWLYATSFFEQKITKEVEEMVALYRKSLEESWMKFGLQEQALAGIYFKRTNGISMAKVIFESLQDRSKNSADKGRFFPENNGGYYWQRDKIGTHSMLLTFYKEMNAASMEIEELRLWLLLNKRSNHWGHTKNTAMATYAMLLTGEDFTADTSVPKVKIGKITVMSEDLMNKGKNLIPFMGYFKQSWSKGEITKDLASLEIEKSTATPSYGALYWQYFENIEKVEQSANPDIDITRRYELVVAGRKGAEYHKASSYSVGDRIRVTLTFETKNDLEYVHLKDLRPSGFEPLENLSRHSWDQGLWYYQSPRDASMNFFIDKLPRGSYTMTYEVFATAKGRFSAGNATIQCMYAPEMVAHSKGELIIVTD
jgi:uncharacterized protein YfaS (alpha-2-macroglobulin family)